MSIDIRNMEQLMMRNLDLLALFESPEHQINTTEPSTLPGVTVRRKKAVRPDLIKQRAEKAAIDLVRWERKLKLARTKVAKLRRKVKYYAKKTGE
jgi:hypothetical protein